MSGAAFRIQTVGTELLNNGDRSELLTLLRSAYGEDLDTYLRDIGAGLHLLGRRGDTLVAHAMYVPRTLYVGDAVTLHGAYVELVATDPAARRAGHATQLLRALDAHLARFDIGALSPTVPAFYARRGWEQWRGPLCTRTASGTQPTPGECVMIRRTFRTPPQLPINERLAVAWRRGEIW